MSTAGPTPPAGWYPDPNNATIQRYWDGGAWTEHTAPGAIATPTVIQPVAPAYPLASAPTATQPMVGATAATVNQGWWAGLSTAARTWLIVGAVAVLLILISSFSAALSGGRSEAEPAASITTPSPEPAEATTPSPTPTPTEVAPPPPAAVDVGAFKNQANSHLDDMTKDLDDMVTTIDEGGFWRLLSNSIELSFNLGQLQGLDIPASVEPTYTSGLVGLETSIDAMTDPIANEDSAALLGVIDTMRAQITEMHNLVNSAT